MDKTETENMDQAEKDLKEKLAELQEENKLLHTQSQLLHDELAKYYKRFIQLDAANSSTSSQDFAQLKSRMLAKEDALKKLFLPKDTDPQVLSHGRSSPGTLKLLVSRGYSNEPTGKLGGKDFTKVLAVYKKGGLPAVFDLLNSEPVTAKVWANALTALAKELRKTDPKKCAELALLAWRMDPRPFRLKWLAFRVHESGDSVLADAIVDMFPADLEIQNKEKERIKIIRDESRHALLASLQQGTGNIPNLNDILESQSHKFEQLIAENAALKLSYSQRDNEANEEITSLQNEVEELQARLENTSALLEEQKMLLLQKEVELKSARTRYDVLEKFVSAEAGKRGRALEQILAALQEKERRHLDSFASLEEIQRQSVEKISASLNELSHYLTNQLDGETGIAESLQKLSRGSSELLENLQRGLRSLTDRQTDLANTIEQKGERQEEQLKEIGEKQSRHIRNAIFQLSAFDGLKQYFSGSGLPQVELWDYGWPANPDFILQLIRLLEQNTYDLIVEFGSGFSTFFTARVLAGKRAANPDEHTPEFISFDHLEEYFEKTNSLLRKEGLEEYADLKLCELAPYHSPDGTDYSYYSCLGILEDLGKKYKKPDCRILVIVDGPPGLTCKNARYPAFPLLMRFFSPASIDFILDDVRREDESEIIGEWQKICESGGIPFIREEIPLEKGACIFQVNNQ